MKLSTYAKLCLHKNFKPSYWIITDKNRYNTFKVLTMHNYTHCSYLSKKADLSNCTVKGVHIYGIIIAHLLLKIIECYTVRNGEFM